jgi:hypothetical protein
LVIRKILRISRILRALYPQVGNTLTLSTVSDNNLGAGGAVLTADGLDLLDDVHAFDDGTENNVLIVEPRSLDGAQEELKFKFYSTARYFRFR